MQIQDDEEETDQIFEGAKNSGDNFLSYTRFRYFSDQSASKSATPTARIIPLLTLDSYLHYLNIHPGVNIQGEHERELKAEPFAIAAS